MKEQTPVSERTREDPDSLLKRTEDPGLHEYIQTPASAPG